MTDLLCPYVTFVFTITQVLINVIYLVPNLFGVLTPDLHLSIGSMFGCNV